MLDPKVHQEVPRFWRRRNTASSAQGLLRDPQRYGDPTEKLVQVWLTARTPCPARCVVGQLEQIVDKGTRTEHAFIALVGLTPTTEGGHRVPAAQAPHETSPLQLGALPVRFPGFYERTVCLACALRTRRETSQHLPRSLPGPRNPSQERSVPRPGIRIEGGHVVHDSASKRIEVQVPNKLEKVRLFLDDDRLVPVLKKMAGTPMPSIEGSGVTREKRAHAPGERLLASANQEVGMIWQKRPGVHHQTPAICQGGKSSREIGSVLVIVEERPTLQSPHHDVMQNAGCIEAWATWHIDSLAY